MNENNNKKEENVFKDLVKMEDEIINEALDLVEEALLMVDSRQYNEAIHYLRQALGLYRQIGRTNEINAIRHKISEIYILKEQQIEENALEDSEVQDLEKVQAQKEFAEILTRSPEDLIEGAEKQMHIEEFDKALELYDVAIKKYREMKNESEIERVYDLIDQCYDAKAKFLIRPEKEVSKEAIKTEAIEGQQEPSSPEIERKEKLKLYEEMKEKETKISNQAYEILEKASELMKILDFDKASELYNEALDLFKEINWGHEIQKIQETLAELKTEKENLLKKLEVKKKEKKEIELKTEKATQIDEKAKQIKVQEEMERFKRLSELEKKKQEEEEFHKQISELVDEAESLNLNYEQDKKKAIKERKFLELESPFNKIIEIYEKIRSMLLERKWTDQTRIYSDQIKLYYEKLEKDKKLREIEDQKIQKQKEYEEHLKVKKREADLIANLYKSKLVKEKFEKEYDLEVAQKKVSNMVDEAIKIAREYEFAIRRGLQSEDQSTYLRVIEIFKKVRTMVLEHGLKDQAEIYKKQIQLYQNKLKSMQS
jgi:hypothetical protein